jgi:hypothetical protein
MNDVKNELEAFEVIACYTRRQAIEDGVLVDVTPASKEAGVTYPVALTRGVYESYVAVPPGVKGLDLEGRLCDVLWMLVCGIRSQRHTAEVRFKLSVRNDNRRPRLVELKAVCGPGDEGEPVITVMHPWED